MAETVRVVERKQGKDGCLHYCAAYHVDPGITYQKGLNCLSTIGELPGKHLPIWLPKHSYDLSHGIYSYYIGIVYLFKCVPHLRP